MLVFGVQVTTGMDLYYPPSLKKGDQSVFEGMHHLGYGKAVRMIHHPNEKERMTDFSQEAPVGLAKTATGSHLATKGHQ